MGSVLGIWNGNGTVGVGRVSAPDDAPGDAGVRAGAEMERCGPVGAPGMSTIASVGIAVGSVTAGCTGGAVGIGGGMSSENTD